MSDDYEINNNKFMELDDCLSKYLFAIWYGKKNNKISNENCQLLKRHGKVLQ